MKDNGFNMIDFRFQLRKDLSTAWPNEYNQYKIDYSHSLIAICIAFEESLREDVEWEI